MTTQVEPQLQQLLSTVKVKALLWKEWEPVNWDGDMWEGSDETEDMESLHSVEWKRSPQPWQNWSPHLQGKWPP